MHCCIFTHTHTHAHTHARARTTLSAAPLHSEQLPHFAHPLARTPPLLHGAGHAPQVSIIAALAAAAMEAHITQAIAANPHTHKPQHAPAATAAATAAGAGGGAGTSSSWCGAEGHARGTHSQTAAPPGPSPRAVSPAAGLASPGRHVRHDKIFEQNALRGSSSSATTCSHCPVPPANVCDLPDVRDMYNPLRQPRGDAWLRPKLVFHVFKGVATSVDITAHDA